LVLFRLDSSSPQSDEPGVEAAGSIDDDAWSATVNEVDADHHRYRALLRDANDEAKRLALIQLLIDEGARDKLAARQNPPGPCPSPDDERVVSFAAPIPERREITGGNAIGPRTDAGVLSPTAGDAPVNGTEPALQPISHEPGPPAPPDRMSPHAPAHKSTETAPQRAVAVPEDAIPAAVASTASAPSHPDDLAGRIASPLSGSAAPVSSPPTAPTASSPASPAITDIEIAAKIQAALAELTRASRPREDAMEDAGDGEARLSLPAPAAPGPETTRSIPAVRAATHDLIERFARLLGKRLVASGAAIPAASGPMPSDDDEEEDSIVRQIQAALAKQNRDA
jgi:hypothetical protein